MLVRLVLTALAVSTAYGGSVVWGGVTPSTVKVGVKPELTIKFTPQSLYVKSDTITITASAAIFAAGTAATAKVIVTPAAANLCKMNKFVTSSTTVGVFTIEDDGGACTWAFKKGVELSILMKDAALTAVNAAATLTFSIVSTKDSSALTSQTGYTVPANLFNTMSVTPGTTHNGVASAVQNSEIKFAYTATQPLKRGETVTLMLYNFETASPFTATASPASFVSVTSAVGANCQVDFQVFTATIVGTANQKAGTNGGICTTALATGAVTIKFDTGSGAKKVKTWKGCSNTNKAAWFSVKYSSDTQSESKTNVFTGVDQKSVKSFSSVVPSTYIVGESPTTIQFEFTPTTKLVGGSAAKTITISSSVALWDESPGATKGTDGTKNLTDDVVLNNKCKLVPTKVTNWKTITWTLTDDGGTCNADPTVTADKVFRLVAKNANILANVAQTVTFDIKTQPDATKMGDSTKGVGPQVTYFTKSVIAASVVADDEKLATAPGKLVFTFTTNKNTANEIARGHTITLTSTNAIFKAGSTSLAAVDANLAITGPHAHCNMNKFTISDNKKILAIKIDDDTSSKATCKVAKSTVVTITLKDTYLAVNNAAARTETIAITTTADTVATNVVYSVAKQLGSVSVTPNHLAQNVAPTDMKFTFTPTTNHAKTNYVSFWFSSDVFTAAFAATAMNTKGTAMKANCDISATVTDKKTIVFTVVDAANNPDTNAPVTCSAADALAAGSVYNFYVTGNLANNPAAGAITISYSSSIDTATKLVAGAPTGYTTLANTRAVLNSVKINGAEGNKAASTAALLEFKFTPGAHIAKNAVLKIKSDPRFLVGADDAAIAVTTSPAVTNCKLVCIIKDTGKTLQCTSSDDTGTCAANYASGTTYTLTTTAAAASSALPAAGTETCFSIESTADVAVNNRAACYTTQTAGAVWTSAKVKTAKAATAPGEMQFVFTPAADIALGDVIVIKADQAIFANAANFVTTWTKTADGLTALDAKCAMSCATTGTKTLTCTMVTNALATAVCATAIAKASLTVKAAANLATNLANTKVTTFEYTQAGKYNLALQTGYTVWTAQVTVGTATPNVLASGKTPTELVLTTTLATKLIKAGTITFGFSRDVFAATGATTIALTQADTGIHANCGFTGNASAKNKLVITIGDKGGTCAADPTLVTGKVETVKVTSNLAAHGAAGAVTFDTVTSADKAELNWQTGYTVVDTQVKAFGPATLTTYKATETSDTLTIKFTPWSDLAKDGTIEISYSHELFAAVGQNIAPKATLTTMVDAKCTFTCVNAAKKFTITITEATAFGAACMKAGTEYTVVIDKTNGNAALKANVADDAVVFAIKTSADTTPLTSQVGWTVGTTPGVTLYALDKVKGGETPTKFDVTLTPTTALVNGNTIVITPSVALYDKDGDCKCTPAPAVTVTTCKLTGTGKVITVTLGAGMSAATAYKLTFQVPDSGTVTAFNANPSTGASVDLDVVTTKDKNHFIKKAAWTYTSFGTITSVTPDTLGAGQIPSQIVIVFKVMKALGKKADTMTFTYTKDVFAAVAAVTMTITGGNDATNCKFTAAATSKKILVITVDNATSKTCVTSIAGNTATTITLTSNLGPNGAKDDAPKFTFVTSQDTVASAAVGPSAVTAVAKCSKLLTATAANFKATTIPALAATGIKALAAGYTANAGTEDVVCDTGYTAAGKLKCVAGVWEAAAAPNAPKCTVKVANCKVMKAASATECTTCKAAFQLQTDKTACGAVIVGCKTYNANVAKCDACETNYSLKVDKSACDVTAKACLNAKTATAANWDGATIPAAIKDLVVASPVGATLDTKELTPKCKVGYGVSGKMLCANTKWKLGTAKCTIAVANCKTMKAASADECDACDTNYFLQTNKKACGNGGTHCKAAAASDVVATDVAKCKVCLADTDAEKYTLAAGVCTKVPYTAILNCKTQAKTLCTACNTGYTADKAKLKCVKDAAKSSAQTVGTLLALAAAVFAAANN